MTKRSKREQVLRRNPAQAPFADVDAVLQGAGFDRDETGGSHVVYRHPLSPNHVTLSPHNGLVKGYQIRSALAALDAVRVKGAK